MAIRRVAGAELVGVRAVSCLASGALASADWVLRAVRVVQLRIGE